MRKALLVGAGFSAEFGLPLAWELTAELRSWLTPVKLRALNREWIKQGGGYHDFVIDTLCSLLLNKKLHYENILGALQTRYNHIDHGYREQFYGLYEWLTEMVYWLLYFRHTRNASYFRASLPFYRGLKTLADKEAPLWIFSLNHDLTVELIAEAFQIPLKSGFSSETIVIPRRDASGNKIGELTLNYLSRLDLNALNLTYLSDGECGINLLKIHGALDIFGYQDELHYLKLQPLGNGISGWLSALKSANEEMNCLYQGKPVKVTNEVAYTDNTGQMQFLRRTLLAGAYKFDNRITQNAPPELLSFFEQRINHFQELITIGYGFGDTHINQIIANWLEFTDERKLRVVLPDRSFRLPPNLMHLTLQIEINFGVSTDFLDTISSTKLSFSQSLNKNFRDKCRTLQHKKNGGF